MLQDEYRNLYKKIRTGWNDSVSIYKDLVSKNITKDTVVLEAGCGFSSLFEKEYKRARRVIGVDISRKFLDLNKLLNTKIVSDLGSMPKVKDNSIDVIISSWVLEHLKKPAKVFSEFRRVLKTGGRVVFITPNNLNYVVFLNKLVPEAVRKFIVGRMAENLVTDPMKTYYKINSVEKIRRLAKRSGLELKKVILNGDPTYVAINKPFFHLGVLIEALTPKPFRVHIIGILKKNE